MGASCVRIELTGDSRWPSPVVRSGQQRSERREQPRKSANALGDVGVYRHVDPKFCHLASLRVAAPQTQGFASSAPSPSLTARLGFLVGLNPAL